MMSRLFWTTWGRLHTYVSTLLAERIFTLPKIMATLPNLTVINGDPFLLPSARGGAIQVGAITC